MDDTKTFQQELQRVSSGQFHSWQLELCLLKDAFLHPG